MYEIELAEFERDVLRTVRRATRQPVRVLIQGKPKVALVRVDVLDALVAAAEELDDIKAFDAALAEPDVPIPSDEVAVESSPWT